MGGAYTALAEGFSAMYWNLAGTAEVDNVAGGFSYSQLYGAQGLDFTWGGALIPLAGGAFGIQIGNLSSGNMPRTTYENPEGGDPAVGNSFSYTATTAMLSYGRRLTDRLNVGFGAKYAQEGISDASRSFVGADVGIKFRTGLYGTTIGAALSNAGNSARFKGNAIKQNTNNVFANGIVQVNYDMKDADMPTVFRFSVMSDLLGSSESLLSQRTDMGVLRLVGEFQNAMDTDQQAAAGAEYGFRNVLFLRAGKRFLNENISGRATITSGEYWSRGLGFGGGVRLPLGGRKVQFDYAWQGAGELPANNHFSFEFGF
jgi:hypothetical protein